MRHYHHERGQHNYRHDDIELRRMLETRFDFHCAEVLFSMNKWSGLLAYGSKLHGDVYVSNLCRAFKALCLITRDEVRITQIKMDDPSLPIQVKKSDGNVNVQHFQMHRIMTTCLESGPTRKRYELEVDHRQQTKGVSNRGGHQDNCAHQVACVSKDCTSYNRDNVIKK